MSDKDLSIAAMKLPPKKRAKLAEQLLDSLDEQGQQRVDRAWAREVERRIDAYDSGAARSKPLDAVLRKLKGRTRR